MAMKRMNIVAVEIDRRARHIITLARQASEAGIPVSQFSGATESLDGSHALISSTTMQWEWSNDGVEAWPGMDVTIVSTVLLYIPQYSKSRRL